MSIGSRDILKPRLLTSLGAREFRIEVLLGLHDLDITYVADKRIITVGKLHVLHGHEWGRNVGSSVNPARTAFLRGQGVCVSIT